MPGHFTHIRTRPLHFPGVSSVKLDSCGKKWQLYSFIGPIMFILTWFISCKISPAGRSTHAPMSITESYNSLFFAEQLNWLPTKCLRDQSSTWPASTWTKCAQEWCSPDPSESPRSARVPMCPSPARPTSLLRLPEGRKWSSRWRPWRVMIQKRAWRKDTQTSPWT